MTNVIELKSQKLAIKRRQAAISRFDKIIKRSCLEDYEPGELLYYLAVYGALDSYRKAIMEASTEIIRGLQRLTPDHSKHTGKLFVKAKGLFLQIEEFAQSMGDASSDEIEHFERVGLDL